MATTEYNKEEEKKKEQAYLNGVHSVLGNSFNYQLSEQERAEIKNSSSEEEAYYKGRHRGEELLKQQEAFRYPLRDRDMQMGT
jgi:hypothetical protein